MLGNPFCNSLDHGLCSFAVASNHIHHSNILKMGTLQTERSQDYSVDFHFEPDTGPFLADILQQQWVIIRKRSI